VSFAPTERQSAALARMEASIGIRSARVVFADADEFQAYWDRVAKRCDAAQRATPASRAAQRERQAERITAYYQDPERLAAYGLAYALRYQPSAAKLRQQLLAKSGDGVLVDQVLLRLSEHVDDDARAGELAERLQQQGRNAQHLRFKLRQRQFPNQVIERCIARLSAATGSVLDGEALVRTVQRFRAKGLSQQAMRGKLMGSPADRAIVHDAVTQAGSDEPALRAQIARLSRKDLDRQVLIRRLAAKGFRYADIVRVLAES
jgi:SOS response regulatory protein OraA/RecX